MARAKVSASDQSRVVEDPKSQEVCAEAWAVLDEVKQNLGDFLPRILAQHQCVAKVESVPDSQQLIVSIERIASGTSLEPKEESN